MPFKKSLPPTVLRVRRKNKAVRSEEAAKKTVADFWAKRSDSAQTANNPYAQAQAYLSERKAEKDISSYEDD